MMSVATLLSVPCLRALPFPIHPPPRLAAAMPRTLWAEAAPAPRAMRLTHSPTTTSRAVLRQHMVLHRLSLPLRILRRQSVSRLVATQSGLPRWTTTCGSPTWAMCKTQGLLPSRCWLAPRLLLVSATVWPGKPSALGEALASHSRATVSFYVSPCNDLVCPTWRELSVARTARTTRAPHHRHHHQSGLAPKLPLVEDCAISANGSPHCRRTICVFFERVALRRSSRAAQGAAPRRLRTPSQVVTSMSLSRL